MGGGAEAVCKWAHEDCGYTCISQHGEAPDNLNFLCQTGICKSSLDGPEPVLKLLIVCFV